MSSLVKWDSTSSRGNILTTELNSLANAARSVASAALDNAANLDKYGWFQLTVTFGSAPSATAYINLYLMPSLDGSNYADGSDTVNPGADALVVTIPILASTSAQRKIAGPIWLPPFKFKTILENQTGQAFPASGSVLLLYTDNEEII